MTFDIGVLRDEAHQEPDPVHTGPSPAKPR
jgi:hypothetical protein